MAVKHAKGAGAQFVYERLREEILSLALAPDQNLDEARLVDRFGLSRTPVREALIRLAADGLVTMLPNRGAQVAALGLMDFPRYVEALDLLQRAVTRLAALRRDEEDLDRLRAAEAAFEAASGAGDALRLTELNRDFHLAVGAAAHNPFLSAHYARLLDEGMRLLRIPFAYEPPEAVAQAATRAASRDRAASDNAANHIAKITAEHRAITKAIVERDADLAETLAHTHTELFRGRFLQYLRQNFATEISVAAPS